MRGHSFINQKAPAGFAGDAGIFTVSAAKYQVPEPWAFLCGRGNTQQIQGAHISAKAAIVIAQRC